AARPAWRFRRSRCTLLVQGNPDEGTLFNQPNRMEHKDMADAVPIRKPSSILDGMKDIQDRIMRRAYEIFEQNGSTLGRDLDNWAQAEREMVWKPAFELSEKDGRFQLEAAISGVDPKDIDIEVTPEDIVLKAETQRQHTTQKGLVHYSEFQS